MNRYLFVAWLLLASAAGRGQNVQPPTAIDRAFNRIYNLDFAGAHAIIDEQIRIHPEDPLLRSVRAAACLFAEYDRLKILEFDFFADDNRVTDKKRGKPDPAVRAQIFAVTAEARKLAAVRLAANPQDRDAMFAMCMAAGVETDYTSLVEKKYFRSISLSKESQKYAHKLLALNPPFYDAYLTLGAVEYAVGSMNFFFRLFIRFDKIEGSKQKGIENLKTVVAGGRYYPPFAKMLLSVIYLREKKLQPALDLLKEVERDFPENQLFKKEVAWISGEISRTKKKTP